MGNQNESGSEPEHKTELLQAELSETIHNPYTGRNSNRFDIREGDTLVATVWERQAFRHVETSEEPDKYAARIVACFNSLKGIDNPERFVSFAKTQAAQFKEWEDNHKQALASLDADATKWRLGLAAEESITEDLISVIRATVEAGEQGPLFKDSTAFQNLVTMLNKYDV